MKCWYRKSAMDNSSRDGPSEWVEGYASSTDSDLFVLSPMTGNTMVNMSASVNLRVLQWKMNNDCFMVEGFRFHYAPPNSNYTRHIYEVVFTKPEDVT